MGNSWRSPGHAFSKKSLSIVLTLRIEGLAGRVRREEDLGLPYKTRHPRRVVIVMFPSREVRSTLLDLVHVAWMREGVDFSRLDDHAIIWVGRMQNSVTHLVQPSFLRRDDT